jgi:hypothetical protein
MTMKTLVLAGLCLATPTLAFPQALTSLQSLRVGYNTQGHRQTHR